MDIFIDRSLSRRAAEALNLVRDEEVLWLESRFVHGTPDPEWIRVAGDEGWLVISKDKKLRTRRENWEAIRDGNVGCFVLTHTSALPRWEALKFLAAHLDEMIERFHETPRPFIYAVNAQGRFTRFDRFHSSG